jgi:hypothetical protein
LCSRQSLWRSVALFGSSLGWKRRSVLLPDRSRIGDFEAMAYDEANDALHTFSGKCCHGTARPTVFRLTRRRGELKLDSWQPLTQSGDFTGAGWNSVDHSPYVAMGADSSDLRLSKQRGEPALPDPRSDSHPGHSASQRMDRRCTPSPAARCFMSSVGRAGPFIPRVVVRSDAVRRPGQSSGGAHRRPVLRVGQPHLRDEAKRVRERITRRNASLGRGSCCSYRGTPNRIRWHSESSRSRRTFGTRRRTRSSACRARSHPSRP